MERSHELRGIMLAIYDDWCRGDRSWLELYAPDDGVVSIGTDPREWWQGGRISVAMWKTQLDQVGDLSVRAGDLQAFRSGDVGWIADSPMVCIGDGPEVAFRITAVFEKRDDAWKIVQWHGSIGALNEDTLGVSLTTSIELLAEWADETKPDLTTSVSPEGTVTIAFTDLEASTALNEQLGDDRWLDFIRNHDRLVRATVSSFGGRTVKGAGDGFMLAFPSARKSIECAIEMQRSLSQEQWPTPVRMRIGVHTGEPLRHGEDFFGRDVAYAARVGGAASGGEILVSRLVKELCAGASFPFEGPRELEFKGFEGAQPVYTVAWSGTEAEVSNRR